MPEPRISRHTVNGRGLQVATSGAGPPLLMLPSILMTHANWSLLRPHLEAHMLLIMPDPLGSGRSDKPDRLEEYTHGAQADLMLGLLDAMQLREAHVIGSALGGATAMAMAGKARDRVRSVALIEGIFAERQLPLWAARMRDTLGDMLMGRMAFGSMKKRVVAESLAKATMRDAWVGLSKIEQQAAADAYFDPEADRKGWLGQLRGAGRDVTPLLDGLQTPILYLRGELSTAGDFLEKSVEFLGMLPNTRVVAVENGAHDLHIQQPKKVAELALAFWREIEERA
jgi:pimeloyl-ACP methyl ester carboxylesterase